MNKLPQALCLGCRRDAHGRSSTAEIEHAAFPERWRWSLLGERGTLRATTRVAPISLRKPNYLALQRNGSAMRSAVRDFP
jgi:hypothetical protein